MTYVNNVEEMYKNRWILWVSVLLNLENLVDSTLIIEDEEDIELSKISTLYTFSWRPRRKIKKNQTDWKENDTWKEARLSYIHVWLIKHKCIVGIKRIFKH